MFIMLCLISQFFYHFLFSHLNLSIITSDVEEIVKSLAFKSRYFLKLSFPVAYSTLPFRGDVSGFQLIKTNLLTDMP